MVFDISQLKKVRKKLDLTQHQFAKEIGISQSMVAKIESGKLDPTYSYVQKIENRINRLTKHEEKEARDIMIKKIISTKPEEKISHVIKLMNKHDISQLPVIDKGKALGLVTESSILEKNLEDVKDSKVKDFIVESPPIISKETQLSVISSLLKYYPLVLVSEKGKLKGLITKADLLNHLL